MKTQKSRITALHDKSHVTYSNFDNNSLTTDHRYGPIYWFLFFYLIITGYGVIYFTFSTYSVLNYRIKVYRVRQISRRQITDIRCPPFTRLTHTIHEHRKSYPEITHGILNAFNFFNTSNTEWKVVTYIICDTT